VFETDKLPAVTVKVSVLLAEVEAKAVAPSEARAMVATPAPTPNLINVLLIFITYYLSVGVGQSPSDK